MVLKEEMKNKPIKEICDTLPTTPRHTQPVERNKYDLQDLKVEMEPIKKTLYEIWK